MIGFLNKTAKMKEATFDIKILSTLMEANKTFISQTVKGYIPRVHYLTPSLFLLFPIKSISSLQ